VLAWQAEGRAKRESCVPEMPDCMVEDVSCVVGEVVNSTQYEAECMSEGERESRVCWQCLR
jgi:hypothetical protein